MRVFLALLWHLARIVAGFILASIAAGGVVVAAWGPMGGAFEDAWTALDFIGSAAFLAIFIGGFAAVPTLVAMAVAEVFRIRSAYYFMLSGGVVAMLPGVPFAFDPATDASASAVASGVPFLTLLAASGFVAGAVYWLIAGRHSGNWRLCLDAEA